MKKIAIITIMLSALFASSKVAIAIKVNGNASIFYKGLKTGKSLKPGTPLNDKDRIQTGKNGFVAIMYLDDKTVIKVLDGSDIMILGNRKNNHINKSLDINYGKIAAGISPQNGKEFKISTPTSVASVKGTELAISSDPSMGDSFTLIEGLIEVTNTITNESTEVQQGETAFSTPEGSLEVNQTTTGDLVGFEEAEIEIQTQELRFEIEDQNGNTKEIIIKFQ